MALTAKFAGTYENINTGYRDLDIKRRNIKRGNASQRKSCWNHNNFLWYISRKIGFWTPLSIHLFFPLIQEYCDEILIADCYLLNAFLLP
jgi:hypothetical protein